MAGLKEIRRRLKSVNNTKKITSAMKLVSAAKLRKTQDAVVRSRAYTDSLKGVLAQLQGSGEYSHPLLEPKATVKHIRVVVLGASRGLCGAFNTNINRKVESLYQELQARYPGCEISAVLLGKKPAEYFRRIGRVYHEAIENLADDPNAWPIQDVCQKVEIDFIKDKIDELHIVYTRFRSAISQTAVSERLLPLSRDAIGGSTNTAGGQNDSAQMIASGTTLFEPNPQRVFDAVVPRIVRASVRQAAFDTKASEHASRMTAMDNATKNAKELIHSLTLTRNKLRQSGITSQLLDIVGGAEALK
jgi:F-type H+-transporting ATPase subunit gamma